MRIGAHVPTRGGVRSAIEGAYGCGAEAVQVFVSNPRGWAGPRIAGEAAAGFREAWAASGLGPLFAHAPYLINIASPNPEFLLKSIELARATVAACEALGADGIVIHAGAGGLGEPGQSRERAAASLQAVLYGTERTAVVVELMAGASGSVASTFPEAARLFDAAGEDRLLLCADTCHLFAAGYRLDEPDGVRACFDDLWASGLADRLVLIHANDAKFERGSRRDRHEHIGQGHIGLEGFRAILAEPAVKDCAVVVETPGRLEDHARNIAVLRSLLG